MTTTERGKNTLEMKKFIYISFILMLISITSWHIFCSIFVIYSAIYTKSYGILTLLVSILFSISVIIRMAKGSNLSWLDVVLVLGSVAPGIYLAAQEALRPYTPNLPWLVPTIVVYFVTVFESFFLKRIQNVNLRENENRI